MNGKLVKFSEVSLNSSRLSFLCILLELYGNLLEMILFFFGPILEFIHHCNYLASYLSVCFL